MKLFYIFIILSSILYPLTSSAISRQELMVGEVTLMVDTTYHAPIGPGCTLTQLHLSGSQPLDVHYITLDLKVGGVSLRAANAITPTRLEKTSSMADRLSGENILYFSGINGDFFDVISTYPDGKDRPRLSTHTSIVDSRILKTSPQGHQFTFDKNGIPRICLLDFSQGSVIKGNESATLGGINIENINYSGDCAPDNAITIYTEDGWKSTFQTQFAGNCAEISAKIIDEDYISAGKEIKVEITSSATSEGNLTIPTNGIVLLGRGAGKRFIENLQTGDIVTINAETRLPSGEQVYPAMAVGGNPPTVIEGIAQESDGSRADAVELHPRTGIGINKAGDKIIMMVIDGRGKSAGATTRQLGDLLVYAGAWNGLNLDGGGSSTLYTKPLGIVNKCSDPNGERAVANSIFAIAEGNMNDQEIAEIRFADWKVKTPRGGVYEPVVYAYNAAGVLIDTDLEGFSLSCSKDLGTITDDGKKLSATGNNTVGTLTATYGNIKTQVHVTLLGSDITPRSGSIMIDGNSEYKIELMANSAGISTPALSDIFNWTSENTEIAEVNDLGVIKGIQDGETRITGTFEDFNIEIYVKVEIAPSPSIIFSNELSDWKVSASSIKIGEITDNGNGFDISYTMGPNITNAKMTLNNRHRLYSHPTQIKVSYQSDIKVKDMSALILPANASIPVRIGNGKTDNGEWIINLEDYFDTTDISIWPLEFISLDIIPGEPAKTSGHIGITGVEAIYYHSSGINDITDTTGIGNHANDDNEEWFSLTGLRINKNSIQPGIYIRRKGNSIQKIIVKQTSINI